MKNTLKTQVGILVVFSFCILGAFALDVKADDSPSPEDYANLSDIQKNQRILEKNREAYEAFVEAKRWNESEVSELSKNGWCPVWAENPSDIKLERCKRETIVKVSYNATISDQARELLKVPCNNDEKCICVNNAIFKHDSSWATAGVGKKANNPGNMRIPRTWTPSVPFTVYHAKGNGQFAKFETLEDGVKANVELYQRFYAQYESADALVHVWADGGGNASYRAAVRNCF